MPPKMPSTFSNPSFKSPLNVLLVSLSKGGAASLENLLPKKIEVSKIASLVLCLCKVHNFCINENDKTPDTAMEDDEVNTVFAGGIHLHNSDTIRTALLDGGNFTSDHNR